MEVTKFIEELLIEVMLANFFRGNPYSCLALELSKRKEIKELDGKEEYLFDIFKANQIFDYPLKDQ